MSSSSATEVYSRKKFQGHGMSDTDEELSALRRAVRKLEDDQAETARKKPNNSDIEPIVAKQNALEVFTRTRLEALHSDNEDIRHILKRMAESLASIDDRLTKHKRETDTELQSVKIEKPMPPQRTTPLQLQVALYVLAGVGLLALMQGAPQALITIFPSMARGGL
jgi:erythromycin esterase-like protein